MTAVAEQTEAPAGPQIVPVPADQLLRYVRQVVPLLQPALDRDGDVPMQALFQELAAQRMQLWVIADGDAIVGAVVTKLLERPLRKVVHIAYVGGRNMDGWLRHLETIEGWAKAIGAARIEVVGRKAWRRVLPGYQQIAVVLAKDLNNAG